MNAARLARHLVQDGVDTKLANSLAEHLAEEVESTVATRDYVEMVVTREVQNLRVEVQRSFTQLNSEITNRLVTQFHWLLGWLALVTVGILVDLLR